ncbi:MAG: Ig-like domain-containing protein, partial [Nitrosopumilaceae archaeon]
MKYNIQKIALVLFVLSTSIIFSSTIDAYAIDSDGRGSTGVGAIEACLNQGQPPNYWPCDTADEWSGGNITFEAGYREGSSIPIRVDVTGLEVEAPWQKLVISWDITKTQGNTIKHTFDYITSFDRNDDPHPCLMAYPGEVCENWSSDYIQIPIPMRNSTDGTTNSTEQPSQSFRNLPLDQTQFWLFSPEGNVTINDIGYVSEGDPSSQGGNTESTQLYVNFTTTDPHVIAAFGAHVASPDDWVNHAVDVNGKSFQIECVEVKGNGGCDGGQINLDAFDVIFPLTAPELTLTKIVNGSNGGNATSGEWQLTADHPSNQGTDITVFGNSTKSFIVEEGVSYTLLEHSGPDGYSPVDGGLFSCSVNNQTTILTETITLNANEKAICTIENIFDNVPPTADSQEVSTDEETALPIMLTGSDVNSDTLTFTIVDFPSNGNLTGFDNNTGAVTYTPNPDYNGDDSFTFQAN